jgi:UDP-4-amino-4,6-dideoxy-N-acetyl-beta-L-altrosamine N-acetyltransferase
MNIEFQNILELDKESIELIRRWRNSKWVSQYMYRSHYIGKEEHQKWISKLKTKDVAKALIIRYNGKPIGLAQLSNIDYDNKTTEWGFYIADESVRGKGIGTAVLYKLINYVFEEMSLKKMSTMVLENNYVAIKLYQKFGFKKEGKLKKKLVRNGKEIDVFLMRLLKDEWKHQKNLFRI